MSTQEHLSQCLALRLSAKEEEEEPDTSVLELRGVSAALKRCSKNGIKPKRGEISDSDLFRHVGFIFQLGVWPPAGRSLNCSLRG